MSGVQPPENLMSSFGTNGANDRPLHARIADLLDDVTVDGESLKRAAATSGGTIGSAAPPEVLAAHEGPAPALSTPSEAPAPRQSADSIPPALPEEGAGRAISAGDEAAATQAAQIPAGEGSPSPLSAEQAPVPTLPAQAISIKGRSDGLAVEIGKGAWPEILVALGERLEQSANFFRNAQVAVDVGPRPLVEDELHKLVELLHTYAMTLGAIRTNAERTFQAALTMGLTATLESVEGVAMADATPAATNVDTAAYFVYRGYLRSGHRLQRAESILVIGDVNPGAEVISNGDVLVWGRLRGVVHAGVQGNQRAIVAALDLEPTQLRIASVATIGPDPRPGQAGKWFWSRSANKRPEVARIINKTIALEEWDATRPGGLVSLRRGG